MNITPELLAAVDAELDRVISLPANLGRWFLTKHLAMAIAAAGNLSLTHSQLWHTVLPYLREVEGTKAYAYFDRWNEPMFYKPRPRPQPEPLKPVGRSASSQRRSRKG